MNKLLNTLWDLGIGEEQEDQQKKHIRLTNKITFYLLFGTCLPFALFIGIAFGKEYSVLLIMLVIGTIQCLSIFALNYFQSYNLSRLLLSIGSVSLTMAYHCYVASVEGGPIPSSSMLQLSVAMIPFIIFGIHEWHYLSVLVVVNLLAYLSFDRCNALLESDHIDESLFRYGVWDVSIGIGALLMAYVVIYFLSNSNRSTQLENNELIKAMNNSKEELQASEKKLTENFEKLQSAQEEEKARNWSNEGLAFFSDLIRRTSGSIEEISYDIIANLIRYLKYNQGGLFLLVEEGGESFLEMKASYAYDRKKFFDKRINIEHGLLGQCVQEKETVLLADAPQDYISIVSGLGDSNPDMIIMVPLKVNDEVFGALELASFNEIQEHEVEFIEKLSETIATSLASVKVNEKTKYLLEDAQMMTEQMKAQEEEMRQNMEELLATQEEVERKNEETEKRLAASKEREIQLEERIKELESQLK